jgi:acetyl esterase/lipase
MTKSARLACALVICALLGPFLGLSDATAGPARSAAAASSEGAVVKHKAYDYGSRSRQDVGAHWDPTVTGKPWVLLIHGGYWSSGSRSSWNASLERFTDAGYAAFAMDYRYSTTSKWPGPRKDAELALAWIRAHAKTFGIDPGRAVAVGWSAGGQIALSLASADAGKKIVRAAVALSPPASPYAAWKASRRAGADSYDIRLGKAAEVLNGAPPDRSKSAVWKLWLSSNVHTRLDAADAPSLLLHAVDDAVVPLSHSTEWVDASLEVDVPSRVVNVPGSAHGAALLQQQLTWDEVIPFLDRRT